MARKVLTDNSLSHIWAALKEKFVAKETGKGLSTNDYTTAEKEKLSGVETNANNYSLPTASASVIGGVRVGAGLAINNGVLSATGGGTADSVDWENIQNIPTGQANGIASLDSSGKVPSTQLPSYVDDVIEGYFHNDKFYTTSAYTTEITGEGDKIYIDLSTNISYRFGGTAYVQITSSDIVEITNAEIDTILAN